MLNRICFTRKKLPVLLALAIQLWSFSGIAATGNALLLGSESKLWLTGTSNVHPYSSRATEILLKARLSAAGAPRIGLNRKLDQAIGNRRLTQLDLTVPVQKLESGKKGLNKRMAAALRANEFPMITFRLRSYEARNYSPEKNTFTVQANGLLRIAGQERPVSLPVEVQINPGGVTVFGQTDLLMSDFGIEPPTAMGGIFKARDGISIHFALNLNPQ